MSVAGGKNLRPVPLSRVEIDDRFWAPRIESNRTVTIPTVYRKLASTGRYRAWTWRPGQSNEPHIFWDSDVAKWLEAAAYSLMKVEDRALERRIDAYVDGLEKGQLADGYANSHYCRVEPENRWTNLRDRHELYCAGHLIEAAVAYAEATGKTRFLDAVCRYADHIDSTFGPRRGQRRGYPGHPEIELALVRLYRATGRSRYLELARFFVDERGVEPHYFTGEARRRGEPAGSYTRGYEYSQSHRPVRAQEDLVGHAVRALYLCSGMADVAAETGDATLIKACRRLWASATEKRMFVTGGIGAAAHNEGLTIDYDLPNEEAYAETCAAIALVFFAQRILHLDPGGRYADVLERALYNGVLSGVSLGGDRFSYVNPLAAFPALAQRRAAARRHDWFPCACCPPNIARLIASLGGYVYSEGDGAARVHLYVGGRAELHVGGRKVEVRQRTDYPWDGRVSLRVDPPEPMRFALSLRIPDWCGAAELSVSGRRFEAARPRANGYVELGRIWAPGDRVELRLAMPVERIEAHPSVRHDCGRIALQRGPIVYCLEECDNGAALNDVALPRGARPRVRRSAGLGGAAVLVARGRRRSPRPWRRGLYRSRPSPTVATEIRAVPYYAWANRAEGEMLVWIRDGGEPNQKGQTRRHRGHRGKNTEDS